MRLRSPDLDLDVAVIPVGVDRSTGEMEIPDRPTVAGWYRYGPSPGQPGSAVLAAHIDSRRYGIGPFEALRRAAPGTSIEVAFEDGTSQVFVVTGRQQFGKRDLPVDELFRREGGPTLTLITCGGAFDRSLGRYEDNVVVVAEPASG